MDQNTQLESLRRPEPPAGSGKKRNWASLLLLLVFLLGTALVFVLVFGKQLEPRVEVTTVTALLLESDDAGPVTEADRAGAMLAQASGWIEPDPFPVRVPVKVDGFVEEVFVYEGDTVKKDQLLATLDATNHTLRLQTLTASLQAASALQEVREREVEQALQDRKVAEAEQASAEARLREAEDRLVRIRSLAPGDLSESEVIAVESTETEARALQTEATARLARSDSAIETRRAESTRQAARVTALKAELEQARVDLERTRITAPMDGIVLKRFAAPGMKRMAGMDDPNSSTIVTLYDPNHLQVRVDVPLSDAGRMQVGLPARVVTSALSAHVFTGRVTRITGEADITRNTLQVKVGLEKPDPALRPEMLCRVEFFGAPVIKDQSGVLAHRVWLPSAALTEDAAGPVKVWVVDPVSETVSSREIEAGPQSRDGLRLIYSGLRPGEQVVLESKGRLTPGTRVNISGETR